MKEFILPSQAVLKIGQTPFSESKALYQAILREAKSLKMGEKFNPVLIMKDLYCAGFSSPEVEACLNKCLERCTYNNHKIDPNTTFEPESARSDYTVVCLRVLEVNTDPFVKGLSVELDRLLAKLPSIQT